MVVEGNPNNLSDQDRILGNFATDIPGTTYFLSGDDADKVEIDSSGILKLKANTPWNVDETDTNNGYTPIYNVYVNANIPNEDTIYRRLYFAPKNLEKNENLINKIASGFNSLAHSFTGQNPFTARANRNSSGTGGINNQIVTESSLTKADNESSSHVESVNSKHTHNMGALLICPLCSKRKK